MLSPLDSPTSQWSSFFSYLILETEDDYRLRAFKRLQAIETWVKDSELISVINSTLKCSAKYLINNMQIMIIEMLSRILVICYRLIRESL